MRRLLAGWTWLMPLAVALPTLSLQAQQNGSEPLLRAPWRAFGTGDYPAFAPASFDAGDLDGDGDLDIVASREFFGDPGISILLNRGDGTFEAPVIYSTPYNKSVGVVKLADMDFDGDLDVVASIPDASGQTNRIGLWRNNGTGTFGARTEFAAGQGPWGLVVADFTGDGFPDVATADYGHVAGTNATVSLMRHNGLTGAQAGFLAPDSMVVGDNSRELAAADLDGDGDVDLAVGRAPIGSSGGDVAVSLLFNEGDGNFAAPVHYEQIPGSYTSSPAVALADMDGDGDSDLLTAAAENGGQVYGMVAIRSNNGDGTFGPPLSLIFPDWTYTPHSIDVGDLDGDGDLDVVATTPSGRANDGVVVVMSDGQGGFQPAVRHDAAKQTFDALVIDPDRDGDNDILTLANDSSVVTVHANPGNGAFLVPMRYPLGSFMGGIDHADVEHDGDMDIVAAGPSGVRLLRNNGDATFPPFEVITSTVRAGSVHFRDMNLDGWVDVLIGPNPSYPPYDFWVALNNGQGGFGPAVRTPVGASQAGDVDAFDLNNDGRMDVVINDPGPASVVYLFRGNGNGTSFTFANTIAEFDGLPFGIAGGDLDHDGNIDLIFNNALGLTVYLGNGDFTVADPLPTSEAALRFVLRDVTGDGEPDLSILLPQDSFGFVEVGVMPGYGDGSFGFSTEYRGPNGREGAFRISSDLDVADVNGDAQNDLILTSNAPNDVSIFLNAGGGALLPQDRYGVGYSAESSTIADFDGDGRTDLATVISDPPSGIHNSLVVLLGDNGGGTGSEAAILTDLEVVKGSILSGGLPQLEASDDAMLRTRSGFGETFADLHHMDARITAFTVHPSPSTLTLSIEQRTNTTGGTAQVRLFNWTTSRFETVRSAAINSTETTVVIENVPAASYVDPDGFVLISVKHIVFVPFFAYTFESYIDHVQVVVQ